MARPSVIAARAKLFVFGVVIGLALCTAIYAIAMIGLRPIFMHATVIYFLLRIRACPLKALWIVINIFINLSKRVGSRDAESLLYLAALFGAFPFGLYLALYHGWLDLSKISPPHEWVMFGGTYTESLVRSSQQLIAKYWFEGIPLSLVGAAILEVLHFAFQHVFQQIGVFGYSFLLFYLTCKLTHYVYIDFSKFIEMSYGGRPPTLYDWGIARLQVLVANVDVMKAPQVDPIRDNYEGRLSTLPRRKGERPTILGTAQRQVDQRAPLRMQGKFEQLMHEIVNRQFDGSMFPWPGHNIVAKKSSFLDSGLLAIRRNLDGQTDDDTSGSQDARGSFDTPDEFGGEAFHVRPDGSSLVVLQPNDIGIVINARYGERHPLATRKWAWRSFFHRYLGVRCPVPACAVLLYAPRDEGEFEVIREIIIAAVWNEANGELYPPSTNTYPSSLVRSPRFGNKVSAPR